MVGAVFENIIGGYLHPRASVRRLLSGGHGTQVIALMVLLAFVVRQIMVILIPAEIVGDAAGPHGIGSYIGALIGALISFGIVTVLICFVGRAFGGTGDLRQSALVVAWYDVVTSITSPAVELAARRNLEAMRALAENPEGPVMLSDSAALVALAGGVVLLWLYAAYIAELHGFRSAFSVLAVLFAMMILPAMLLTPMLMGA